ncbi:hypothetical protein COO09_16150 [Rhizorhabdus dicambivorans]|uniref:Uncharacterized protein n=2 Tax=Rhizorhabdus dicambivorans TaxID=1850238 RepID=A0A2A4FUU0_9SPHN|nr:hypothetical protein COO09_16150 [Rhizorhabdus dicambivorans]
MLGDLTARVPNFGTIDAPARDHETLLWIGRLLACIEYLGDGADIAFTRVAAQNLGGLTHEGNVTTLLTNLYSALAKAEARLPTAARGTFIGAGNAMDGLAAVARVFGGAAKDLLIVDPYMGERAVMDFIPMAAEGIRIRLLADAASVKPGLNPAVEAWARQYGRTRPLVVRLAPARSLHDRLVLIDGATAWSLTQSLEHLAQRSPASVARLPAEVASLKISFFDDLWAKAQTFP